MHLYMFLQCQPCLFIYEFSLASNSIHVNVLTVQVPHVEPCHMNMDDQLATMLNEHATPQILKYLLCEQMFGMIRWL